MKPSTLDRKLLDALMLIPEIGRCGFAVREGLTGAGVTVLKGHNYFGSWRVTAGELVWVHANIAEPNHFEQTVEDATRYTLLLMLRSIEHGTSKKMPAPAHAMAS